MYIRLHDRSHMCAQQGLFCFSKTQCCRYSNRSVWQLLVLIQCEKPPVIVVAIHQAEEMCTSSSALSGPQRCITLLLVCSPVLQLALNTAIANELAPAALGHVLGHRATPHFRNEGLFKHKPVQDKCCMLARTKSRAAQYRVLHARLY
jgi:hypothetical protein